MNQTFTQTSLSKLAGIYAHKLRAAQLAVQAQRQELQVSIDELAERTAVVQGLQDKLAECSRYMQDPDVSSDAKLLESAFRYRHWVQYDMERQVYYLELTQEEVEEKREELNRRVQVVTGLDGRLDTVADLTLQSTRAEELLRDELAEEETESLMAGRMAHGQIY